jgi:preprotein translocase subunit SecG
MTTVLLVIHLMIAAALVGVVLIQKSEGGALGIGGGGGGFMTGRGAANLLTRVTAVLAAAFFGTSILLAVLASQNSQPQSIIEGSTPSDSGGSESPSSLPSLKPIVPPSTSEAPAPSGPQVPQSQ